MSEAHLGKPGPSQTTTLTLASASHGLPGRSEVRHLSKEMVFFRDSAEFSRAQVSQRDKGLAQDKGILIAEAHKVQVQFQTP